MKISFSYWALVLAFIISACGVSPTPDPYVLTPPAISVNLTKAGCPSIEIQPGMQIAWTNMDDVDRPLIIESVDEQGVVVDSGGTQGLQPGSTFMITLMEEGQYTYYCSTDRKEFGTINVVPNASASINARSMQESPTPQCAENLIPPAITEIQPAEPVVGSEITVIGSGGFMQDSCGGVNESAKSFPLYLDNESAADLQCYVNHCEAKLRLGDTLADGAHCLSMQKDEVLPHNG